MGNRSSRGSFDYPLPPVPIRHMNQIPEPMPPYDPHPPSNSSSSPNLYDFSRKRRPWYSWGRRKDRYRGHDLWYQPFVSPEGQVVPPPPGFVYDPGTAWGANFAPNEPQYAPTQFPGHIPPPVVPVPPGMQWDQYQNLHYMQSQPGHEPHMMMPQPQPAPPPFGASPDSAFSPPFKPFAPLPRTQRQRPPTPPQNIMALSPYKDSFRHLAHPSPSTQARVLDILRDPDQTNIQRAHQQWQRQDEQREKMLQEARERRKRMLNGAVVLPAPISQTVPPAVPHIPPVTQTMPTDPRFVKKKKQRKSLFNSLFRRRDHENLQSNTAAMGPRYAMPSFSATVIPAQRPSPVPSAHTLAPTPHVAPVPTPAVMPSPFVSSQTPAMRSTTPPFPPPPNSNFVEVTTEMYADLLPMSLHSVIFPPDTDPSQAERWPTAAHLYLASRYLDVKPKRAKKIKKTQDLEEAVRLVQREWDDGNVAANWESIKTNMLEDIMYLKFYQHPALRRLLVETGNLPIICNVQHYILRDHSFGMMLMRVRDRLLNDGENNG